MNDIYKTGVPHSLCVVKSDHLNYFIQMYCVRIFEVKLQCITALM